MRDMDDSLQSEQAARCALLCETFEEIALRGFALAIDEDAATNLMRRGGSGLAGATTKAFDYLKASLRSFFIGIHEVMLQIEENRRWPSGFAWPAAEARQVALSGGLRLIQLANDAPARFAVSQALGQLRLKEPID